MHKELTMNEILKSKKATISLIVLLLIFVLLFVEIALDRYPVDTAWILGTIGMILGTYNIGQGIADKGRGQIKAENIVNAAIMKEMAQQDDK